MTTTRTSPITAEVIRQAVDGIDSLVRAEIRENYIGRRNAHGGPVVSPCIGVVLERPTDLLALGASIAYVIGQHAEQDHWAEDIDDAIGPLHRARIDELLDAFVVYWPEVTP